MQTSKQTNHLTINLLENDDILKYLVEHNMTNEGELYLVEGESDYAQSDWGVTDSADPAYILNKPDLSAYLTSDDISGKVDKAGDTMTGKLFVPQVETGTASDSYFQSRFFRGEGNTSTYYHAIDFGYANHNQVDFHEYGAVWNFYRNTSGTSDGGTLVGKITSNGWEAGAKLTGSPTAPTPAKGTNTTQIATTAYVQTELQDKLNTNGDGSRITTAFTSASSRENISTGETLQTSFSKISKWLSDLSNVAFTGDYADLNNTPTISNDLTDDLKTNYDTAYLHSQSAHAPASAEENVQSDWNVTDISSDAYILNKPDLSAYATQIWVENKNYLTEHQDISGKLDKTGDGSDVTVSFTTATSRQVLTTGEKLSSFFGKITKWLSDLKNVAFSGSYNDLSDTPTIPTVTNDLTNELKANYDAAYTHSISEHAPVTAEENIQSDWNVTDETSDAFILNKPSSLPANGGNADTVDDKHASDFALATDITDMATQTWVGQQGYVTASEGEIVDPVPEYATTEYIASLDHVTRTEMLTEIERQIQGAINASY